MGRTWHLQGIRFHFPPSPDPRVAPTPCTQGDNAASEFQNQPRHRKAKSLCAPKNESVGLDTAPDWALVFYFPNPFQGVSPDMVGESE